MELSINADTKKSFYSDEANRDPKRQIIWNLVSNPYQVQNNKRWMR